MNEVLKFIKNKLPNFVNKNSRGFTLTEILIASAISIMIFVNLAYVLHNFFTEQKSMEIWTDVNLEANRAFKAIHNEIRNTIKLTPFENLNNIADSKYIGVTSLKNEETPEICMNDENFKVIQYTALMKRKKSEVLRRAWSEQDSANKNGSNHQLRVSWLNGDKSVITSEGDKDKEITIVDADQRFIRRYRVTRVTLSNNVTIDPYDNAVHLDSTGNPIRHTYWNLELKSPYTSKRTNTNTEVANFVTGSDVYESETNILCVHKNSKQVVKYNVQTDKYVDLFNINQSEFNIQKFYIGYLNTNKANRIDKDAYFLSVDDLDHIECLNVLKLEVIFVATAQLQKKIEQLSVREARLDLSRSSVIYPHNLNMKRPIFCTQ